MRAPINYLSAASSASVNTTFGDMVRQWRQPETGAVSCQCRRPVVREVHRRCQLRRAGAVLQGAGVLRLPEGIPELGFHRLSPTTAAYTPHSNFGSFYTWANGNGGLHARRGAEHVALRRAVASGAGGIRRAGQWVVHRIVDRPRRPRRLGHRHHPRPVEDRRQRHGLLRKARILGAPEPALPRQVPRRIQLAVRAAPVSLHVARTPAGHAVELRLRQTAAACMACRCCSRSTTSTIRRSAPRSAKHPVRPACCCRRNTPSTVASTCSDSATSCDHGPHRGQRAMRSFHDRGPATGPCRRPGRAGPGREPLADIEESSVKSHRTVLSTSLCVVLALCGCRDRDAASGDNPSMPSPPPAAQERLSDWPHVDSAIKPDPQLEARVKRHRVRHDPGAEDRADDPGRDQVDHARGSAHATTSARCSTAAARGRARTSTPRSATGWRWPTATTTRRWRPT